MKRKSQTLPFPRACLVQGLAALVLMCMIPSNQIHAESVTDTITRALEDTRSDNPELRRGGVMLLGKYPRQPRVMDALVGSLEDPDTGVRRAAAVSILEHVSLLNTVQAREVLRSLGDSDKEVRITISAWLPQLILRARRSNQLGRNTLVLGNELREFQEPVLNALSDSEALVRRKAVESLRYLSGPLPTEQLVALFDDPDPQVRLAAYPVLRNLIPPEAFAAATIARWPEPHPQARLALAEAAATRRDPEMEPLLQRLSEDEDPAIHLMAAIGRFLLNANDGLPDRLKTALGNDQLERSLVQRIIQAVRSMNPDQREPVIKLLLESNRPFIRGQAVGLWLQSFAAAPPSGKLVEFLEDPEPSVRQQALRFLATRPQLVEPRLIMSLPDNPYLDVRQRALSLLRALEDDQQTEILMRLLFDTEPNIRSSVLTRIAQRKPDNWPTVFRASLRDPSPLVRRTAANTLLRALGAEGVTIAREFAREQPGTDISRHIQQQLSRLNP